MHLKSFRIFLLFLLTSNSIAGQRVIDIEETSNFTTYVKGNNFDGVIFNKDYQMPYFDNPPKDRRFTPSIIDIETVEKILQKELKQVNTSKNQGPTIHKKLRKYHRQYIGFVSQEGERIIFLNCNWQKYNLIRRLRGIEPRGDSWKTGFQIYFDGGSYHWNIKINLDKKELVDLRVNGVS